MTASLTIPPGSQPVADGQAIPAGAATQLYNGATWDRAYGNVQGALLASLARTASASAPLVTNPNHRGVLLFLNVTAAPPTPPAGAGLQVQLALVDPISGLALYRNPNLRHFWCSVWTRVLERGYEDYPHAPSPHPVAAPGRPARRGSGRG